MRGPFVNMHTALVLYGRAADYELCGWRLPMCLSWVMCTYVRTVAQVTKFTLISFLTFWYSNVILRQLHCKYLCAYLLPSLCVCVCCTVCQFDVSLYACGHSLLLVSVSARPNTPGVSSDKPPSAKTKGGKGGKGGGKGKTASAQQQVDGLGMLGWLVACV